MFDKIEKWPDHPLFPVWSGIVAVVALLVVIYYLYKLNKKKKLSGLFWFILIMLATALAFQLDPENASLSLGVPTLIGFGYFFWRFLKAETRMDKFSNMCFMGALFFMGLSFRSYIVMEYTILTAIFLAAGLVAEFKKLEK